MRPNPQKQNPAGGRGFAGVQTIERGLPANDSAMTRDCAMRLLIHAADVLACAAAVILADGRISTAGREVVLYTACRLRELREVLS